jgi:putative CocE/NonD family hydrolase
MARFGRLEKGKVTPEDLFWTDNGYALLLVDLRGTGASFGTSRFGPSELGDMRRIAQWVSAQPWSNGKIGAYGISFQGTAAELLAASGHPAVRAVAPLYSDYEYYADLVRPGGILLTGLLDPLSGFMKQQDSGASAQPVQGDPDGALLRAAVADHRANIDMAAAARSAQFSDDPLPGVGASLSSIGVSAIHERLSRSRVPMLVQVGWLDAGTARGALDRYRSVKTSQSLFIGPWSHAGNFEVDPFRAGGPATVVQPQQRLSQLLPFFDRRLKEAKVQGSERSVHYYTMGAGCWRTTAVWPPQNLRRRSLHLTDGGELSPALSAKPIKVHFQPTDSGETNRWQTQLGGGVVDYRKAATAMQLLPGYLSSPLAQSVEMTGSPLLRLKMKLEKPPADPAVFAYLFAVDAQGTPRYLTEGQLLLRHRRPAPGPPSLHSYRRADSIPLRPGQTVEATVALLPTSVLLRTGDRLRLLLASGDKASFEPTEDYRATLLPGTRLDLPMSDVTKPICAKT